MLDLRLSFKDKKHVREFYLQLYEAVKRNEERRKMEFKRLIEENPYFQPQKRLLETSCETMNEYFKCVLGRSFRILQERVGFPSGVEEDPELKEALEFSGLPTDLSSDLLTSQEEKSLHKMKEIEKEFIDHYGCMLFQYLFCFGKEEIFLQMTTCATRRD